MQTLIQSLPFSLFKLCNGLIVLAVIFLPLEKFFSLHTQKFFRKSFLRDIAYYFINGMLPNMLLAAPLAVIAWALHHLTPAGLQQWVGSWPLGFRFAAGLVVGEIGYYWGHRWTHTIPYLWRFHAIHHSAEEMDWLVNTRAHPLDLVFTRICAYIPLYVTGLAQPLANRLDMVVVLLALFNSSWGYFLHANVRWRFGWLEWLVATPAFHHWHHTNDGPELINKNYSAFLPWMDKLFGTFHLPKEQRPGKYGIDDPVSTTLREQLVEPFFAQPSIVVTRGQKES